MLPSVSGSLLAEIATRYGTPCWVYDASVIRRQIEQLRAFDVIRFAQKANSNVHILRLMRSEGVQVDAVSLGELERALLAGYEVGAHPSPIVFTADLLDRPTLKRVVELKVPVNAGSPQMLEQVGALSPGHPVWIRINPGFGHGHSKKTNTGGEHSKHGIWHTHLADCLSLVDRHRLELEGLHMHIGSGVDYAHLGNVCDAMVSEVKRSGRDLAAISAGGGLTIPYRSGDPVVDTAHYYELWDAARREIASFLGHPVKLEIEPGRFLVAQSGVLVSELRAQKPVGENLFTLVDAGFNDLMRPAMYGSHHRISLLSADGTPRAGTERPTVVAGPLCESGDVFTQAEGGEVLTRLLPPGEVGDWVVFHDAGAYGSSMSSNYNTRPLIPEVLVDGGQVRLIRRRQTVDELLALER
ncbi:MAG TPA: diaminopimelate decarboxylase [Polyangiaceae bacterium]|nr:diaminopimelate decarboxylase [Polyangiaceae bacterium]